MVVAIVKKIPYMHKQWPHSVCGCAVGCISVLATRGSPISSVPCDIFPLCVSAFTAYSSCGKITQFLFLVFLVLFKKLTSMLNTDLGHLDDTGQTRVLAVLCKDYIWLGI